jgi:D-serine deaminase-like pyridoxal phosphate-dependent protein
VLVRPELVAGRPSEEHLPLDVTSGTPPPRGTPLHLVPRHVCPTVNLAEQAVLIERGRIVDVVPVAGRAHDLER